MKFHDDISYQLLLTKLDDLGSITKLENESTTRLRAIDTILFDILSWDKNLVETEKYCRAEGYADYVFLLNNIPFFVLEAKRSGIEFILPDRSFENRPYAFGLMAKECPSAMSALQQAIGYATTLGARYVAISNGHQWLFSLTFVQGQSLETRLVYVFESLNAISSRFSNFFLCFSKQGIETNAISYALLDTLKLPAPAKLSSRIPGYPMAATRNLFQNELTYILDYVWQVMSQDEGTLAFVENCYVNPSSHKDTLILVHELIEKRISEDDVLREYEIESIDKLPHKLAHLPAEKPFIVLGEVGRGKSSFLKYLRLIAAKDVLDKFIQIELDFIDRPDIVSEIPSFVYGEIERQLRENYSIDIYENNFVRGVLHFDLQRLKKTPEGAFYSEDKDQYNKIELDKIEKFLEDKHTYLTKVIHHLKKGRKYSIALFFDNLDRRDIDLQEKAFLKASAIARDWASLVFICLRPDTYYRSQQSGVLDTIAPTVFTVGQPDLSLILKRRFAYAKKVAEGNSLEPTKLTAKIPSKEISFYLPKVSMIFESCEFAARKRNGIIPTLEAVSNGNIRRLLDLSRKILCSSHLDTKKIVDIIEKTGNYTIPDFEGVKTLLYGDYMHYDPSRSPFLNIFDIKHADPLEHFLRFSILHYLSKIPIDRYVPLSELNTYLTTLGYIHSISLEAIRILIEKYYVRKPVGNESDLLESDQIRITSLGKYHLYSLITVFQYLEACLIDTPILDDELRNEIEDVTGINERLLRAEKFLKYLDECSDQIRDPELLSSWKSISRKGQDSIEEIRIRINKNDKEKASDS